MANKKNFNIYDIANALVNYLQDSIGWRPSAKPSAGKGDLRSRIKMPKFTQIMLVFGLLFLYVPLIIVVIYSFNDSRIVTIWTKFSFKWYGKLLQDTQMVNSAIFSLTLATITACLSVVIGTMVAFTLNRIKKFPGKSLFVLASYAPLVIPEIILGLALLLFFISLENLFGFPKGRGFFTLLIAHTVFCQSFVSVVVLARLRDIDPFLEEAAMDLGARPLKTFFRVILPVILPALISAWLLSFILSMDDVVIASFVSGPGATTLPINIFSSLRLGVAPKINVIATIIITVVGVLSFLAYSFQRRAEKKYKEDQHLAFMQDQKKE